MREGLGAAAAMGLALFATGMKAADTPKGQCRTVQARYAIYVNNDALWVLGSKHLLMVSDSALDRQLQARGWRDTVAYGDFTLCAERLGDPRRLTIKDRVWIAGYANLKFRPRDTRAWL